MSSFHVKLNDFLISEISFFNFKNGKKCYTYHVSEFLKKKTKNN